MKKVALSLLAVGMVVSMSSALEIEGAMTEKAMAVAVETAPEKDSTVNVSNSKINNTTDVQGSAVAGNTGVQVKGKNVDIKNSKINNQTSVKNSAVAGNTGVAIKAEKVNVSNSKINNTSNIKDSAVAGNTGVELGN